MINKGKLWVVSELFFPEETSTAYIMTKIAETLTREKKVHVICGDSSYQNSNLKTEARADHYQFEVTRVKSLSLNKDRLLQRILRLILLSIQLSYKLLTKSAKGDEVLIVTNPAPLVLLIVLVCKIKRMKCYAVVHDVFPENLVAAKLIKPDGLVYSCLKSLFDGAYSKMYSLFVLGRDMKVVFEHKLERFKTKPSINIVENWAETVAIHPDKEEGELFLKEHGIKDKIVFQFAGNMGRVQGLMELCEVAAQVKNPLVHFMFIGDGAVKEDMKEFVSKKGMDNVSFINPMPRNMQNRFLNAANVGIVSLQSGMTGLGVPSKSYNILSAGNPILFIGSNDSEIAQMIDENKVGWCFNIQEMDKLVSFLNGLSVKDIDDIYNRGQQARDLAVNRYSEEIIMDKYLKLVANGN